MLRVLFVACLVVVLVTLIATQLTEPTPVQAGRGPMYPRMRAPRTDTMGDLLRAMGIGSLTWYACVLCAPFFLWLGRRFPFDRRQWPTSLGVYAFVIALLVALTALVQHQLTYAGLSRPPALGAYMRAALLTGTLPFITVAAATQAFDALMRARSREIEAARMRSQLAEARLEALSAQLQPHFLFNTLQAISTLIRSDPEAADRSLTNLSDLLRSLLQRGEREVALEEELRVLEPYLEIARTRFGTRLTITITTDDQALRALVPFFVLQPLVENALHHGVSSRAGPAAIQISAEKQRDRLALTVRDDGPGPVPGEPGRGVGLSNTGARLQEMYGERGSFQYGPRAEGGFQVRIDIPFRTQDVARDRA